MDHAGACSTGRIVGRICRDVGRQSIWLDWQAMPPRPTGPKWRVDCRKLRHHPLEGEGLFEAVDKHRQNNVVAKYRGTGPESRLASFKPCIASAESDYRGGSEYLALRMQRWGGIIAVVPEQQHAEFESSSVAQGAYDLGLWDCRSISYRSSDHCTVAGVSFGSCSRVTVSLRHHVHCVVWWSGAGIARDGPLRARFPLLFPAPDALVSSKDRRDTTHSHFYGVSPHCRVAERCAKERYRIAEAGAR